MKDQSLLIGLESSINSISEGENVGHMLLSVKRIAEMHRQSRQTKADESWLQPLEIF